MLFAQHLLQHKNYGLPQFSLVCVRCVFNVFIVFYLINRMFFINHKTKPIARCATCKLKRRKLQFVTNPECASVTKCKLLQRNMLLISFSSRFSASFRIFGFSYKFNFAFHFFPRSFPRVTY